MPKNAKAVMGILFVFILGAVSGSLVTRMVLHGRLEAFMHDGPGVREEHIVKRLSRELNLDNGQQDRIRGIVHETHTAVLEARSQIRPRIETLLEQGQGRIAAVLRPEQREKFMKLIAERKANRLRERPSPEH